MANTREDKVRLLFGAHPDKDDLFLTSDDRGFWDAGQAKDYAVRAGLKDRSVTPFHREKPEADLELEASPNPSEGGEQGEEGAEGTEKVQGTETASPSPSEGGEHGTGEDTQGTGEEEEEDAEEVSDASPAPSKGDAFSNPFDGTEEGTEYVAEGAVAQGAENVADAQSLTVEQLKAELDAAGVTYPKKATKAALIDLLKDKQNQQ